MLSRFIAVAVVATFVVSGDLFARTWHRGARPFARQCCVSTCVPATAMPLAGPDRTAYRSYYAAPPAPAPIYQAPAEKPSGPPVYILPKTDARRFNNEIR